MVLLTWTNIVLCVWINKYCFRVSSPRTLLPLWCHSLTVDMDKHNGWHRENTLQPTKDRGWHDRRVSCGHGSWHATIWLFHNSSDLNPEKWNSSPCQEHLIQAPAWVKMSTICQLHLTRNLSRLLPNTYTVKWQRTKEVGTEVGTEAGRRGKEKADMKDPAWQRCEHVTKLYAHCLFESFMVITSYGCTVTLWIHPHFIRVSVLDTSSLTSEIWSLW